MGMPIERISGFDARDFGCNTLDSGRTRPGELNTLFLSIDSLPRLSMRPCNNCSTGAIGQEDVEDLLSRSLESQVDKEDTHQLYEVVFTDY